MEKVNSSAIVLALVLASVVLSGSTLYYVTHSAQPVPLVGSQKSNLVLFMQSSDSKAAHSALERAIILKKNNAVKDVEVVFGGDGVVPVAEADDAFRTRLDYAHQLGISLSGCNAGLVNNKLTAADLPSFFTIYPYGIVHTLDLTAKGYTVMQY